MRCELVIAMDYADIVRKDNPDEALLDETGFCKFLRADGVELKAHQKKYKAIERYLNTFGFVKGRDTITMPMLDTLKHIHQYNEGARACTEQT